MIDFSFRSTVLAEDSFQVLRFAGEEEISRLFRFEIDLVSRDPNIDLSAVLESQAFLSLTTHGHTRYFQGMLAMFKQGGRLPDDLYCYRAILVPRIWTLTQSRQNQIYQKKTVPQIIEAELLNTDHKGSHPVLTAGMTSNDYSVLMSNEHQAREYVVQYKETDLNFVSRLMEHEGIFYFFEHSDSEEKLVIADSNIEFPDVTGGKNVPFRDVVGNINFESNAVHEFSLIRQHIPNKVLLKDFNYREPHVTMQADNIVDDFGIGFVTEYGAHFKTPEEGVNFASVRTEELQSMQNCYEGKSNNAAFSCGHLYALTDHFRDDFNQDYLLTRVKHCGDQEIKTWATSGNTHYQNEFSCIPSKLQYRPPRITPKPKLYGVMNGVIDSEQEGLKRADIDEYGRYKVLMPFDISGAGPGQASRRIRMAQPYGGSQQGMSFPLVPGTEVIWTCIDGDLDRPIITGAVPNPLNPSVTNAENSTSNVIRTASGITMGFNDGSPGGVSGDQGQSGNELSGQQQNQKIKKVNSSMGSQASAEVVDAKLKTAPVSSLEKQSSISLEEQQQQSALSLNTNWQYGQDIHETDTNFQIHVPYQDADQTNPLSYLRMGNKSNNETISNISIPEKSGWLDYTDGDRVTVTQGSKKEVINGGNYDLIISDGGLMTADAAFLAFDNFRKVGNDWRRSTAGYLSTDTYTAGDSEEFFAGFKFDGMIGLSTSAFIGGKLDVVGLPFPSVDVKLGTLDVSIGMGWELSYVEGDKLSVAESEKIKARDEIKLYVKSGGDDFVSSSMSKAAAITVGVGAAVAATGAVFGAIAAAARDEPNYEEVGVGAGIGAATGVYAGAIIAATLAHKGMQSSVGHESEIKLTKTNLELIVGTGAILPAEAAKLDMKNDGSTRLTNSLKDGAEIKITANGSIKAKAADGGFVLLDSEKHAKQFIQLKSDGKITISAQDSKNVQIQNGRKNFIVLKKNGIELDSKSVKLKGKKIKIGPAGELSVG